MRTSLGTLSRVLALWPAARLQAAARMVSTRPVKDAAVVEAHRGPQLGTVIFMHGLGDSGDGWSVLFDDVIRGLPKHLQGRVRLIFPHAPHQPVSLNNGFAMRSWFDIIELNADAAEDEVGMEATAARIGSLIDDEVAAGIPPERILVGGFSQGGAVALRVALLSRQPLGGCIALSTWLHSRSLYPGKLGPYARKLRLLQAHGSADSVVSPQWGKASHELLTSMGVDGRFVDAPGVGHGADASVLRELTVFLAEVLEDSIDSAKRP